MRQLLCALLTAGLVSGLASQTRAADEARAIIAKAIKAHRGKAKTDTYTASQTKIKGSLDLGGGIEFTQEITVQFPNKIKQVMTFEVQNQAYTTVTVYNGKEAWVTVNGKDPKLDKKKLLEAMKDATYVMTISQLTPLKDKKYKLSTLGEIKVNDKPAVGIKVTCKGQKDADFYFDKKTHLLVKIIYKAYDFMSSQEVEEERIFTEYQEVEGRKVPKKVVVNRDGKKLTEVEVTETTILEKLDDSEFAKP
jgi:hypothetical protein